MGHLLPPQMQKSIMNSERETIHKEGRTCGHKLTTHTVTHKVI